MNIGDEIEVEKSDDPNHGRAGHVARIPHPQAIDVAFEGGMERATYAPEHLRPVKARPAPGQQSEVRGWAELWNIKAEVYRQTIRTLLFWQAVPVGEENAQALLTTDDPQEFYDTLRAWQHLNEKVNETIAAMLAEQPE